MLQRRVLGLSGDLSRNHAELDGDLARKMTGLSGGINGSLHFGQQGPPGPCGPQGPQGPAGPEGKPGKDGTVNFSELTEEQKAEIRGDPGKDGVSAEHSWDGTVLTITSASGTSSADLKGEKGEPGKDGAVKFSELTEAEKAEIAEMVAGQVEVPDSGGNVDLTGYATEQYVKDYAQPKGEYLTEVPDGYAKTVDIPTKPEDIGAQPSGNYLTEVPSGYATEEFVKNKIAEAELGGEEVDLSGYAQKSELPTKVSQLENDSGYLTEHQDISGKLDASALPSAINSALAQAKASGEFDGKDGVDGKDGYTPVKGVDYFDGQPGKDGSDGKDGYTPQKGIDYFDGQPGEKGDKGDPGEKGEQGEQGIQGEKGDKGDTGAPGANGKDGQNGYTPVRGTDYWTATDIAEIKSYVDNAILGGAW